MIEIRVLKYFNAIVEEGNFTKAAKKLHITQPTLSRQIKEFEDYYGVELIDRNFNPVKITDEGMLVYHKAKEIIEFSEKLEQDLISKNEIEGTINIGAVESAGAERIYQILCQIIKENPNIKFNFFHSDSNDIKNRLNSQLLDIGILTEPVDLSHFNYLKLPELDTWYILVSKENELSVRKSLKWEDLKNSPLLLSERFAKFREFPEFFNSETNNFNILATFTLFSNAVFLVENNVAVAPCIKAVHSIKNNKKVKCIPLEPKFQTGSFLVWKKDEILNKPAKKVLDLLIEEINKPIA